MSSSEKSGDQFKDWEKLVHEFRKQKILAFLPGEPEYELSCATANLLYRFTRPHFVVQPETYGEVLTIVDRVHKLELYRKLTVKCGGHSYTGFSTVDQGIVVDLRRMTEVRIDFTKDKKPDVAVIQAGARWGDVYRKLIRTDCRGYVVNGGRCPSVGVGGFILGGGLGPFGRTLGMGSDTLVGATIITLKDDKVVKLDVDDKNDPQLFWALRGGGTAAFGIVTEFRMKVCALKNRDVDHGVVACRYVWTPDQDWKLMKEDDEKLRDEKRKKKNEQDEKLYETMEAFYAAPWPDEMTIDSNWMLDMSGDTGKLGIRWTLYYDGPESECDDLLGKYIKDDRLKNALQKRTIPEPTTRFLHETLFLMWEEEARLALPKLADNEYQLWCSFVFEGDAQKMSEVVRAGKKEQDRFEQQFKNEKASMWVTFIHSGGQVINKGNDSTSAYPWRTGVFQCSVLVKWSEKWLEVYAREAILRIKNRLSDYSVKYDGECASYVNFSDATLALQGDPQKAYYGQHHTELLKLKQERDPKNLFQWPWATDTQQWRHLPGEVRASGVKSKAVESDASLAKTWRDSIAGHDWDTYELPPPSYTELYAPYYMQPSGSGIEEWLRDLQSKVSKVRV